MLARDEFLTNLLQIETDLEGHHFKVPILYRDASSLTAIFPARAKVAARLLPHPALAPTPLAPAVATVALTFFEYRDTDIGPYNEMAVSIPCVFGQHPVPFWTVATQMRRRTISAYVLQLPVTTEIARVGGVELYGYPKIVARVGYRSEGGHFEGDLHVDDRRVLGLGGTLPARHEAEDVPIRYVTYSMRASRLMEGQVTVRADTLATARGGRAMELDLDDGHPIATQLRDLLLSRHPIHVEHASRFRSILHAPTCLE